MTYNTYHLALSDTVAVNIVVNLVFTDPTGSAARHTLCDVVSDLIYAYFEALSTAIIARPACHLITIPIARWTYQFTARLDFKIALPFAFPTALTGI
jgi:ABC-type sulfate transport system permease component